MTFRREGFSQVKFVADTSVVNALTPGSANFVAASLPIVANSGNAAILSPGVACVIGPPAGPPAPATHIECKFNFDSSKQPFDYPASPYPQPFASIAGLPQPTITFDLTVQSPTGAPASMVYPSTLNLASTTTVVEVGESPEPEYYSLTTTLTLTVPDPTVVETYVPVAGGTVTTGSQGGAATCLGGALGSDPNKWVTIVKVPEPAQVGVNLNRSLVDDTDVPLNTIFFSRIQIPNLTNPSGDPQLFGVGTRWYDPDAKTKLVVNTLRRDKCTIGSGLGTLKDALLILKEKIYYKPDKPYDAAPENPPVYKQVLLCLVTSGPYPGQPCILYARVYSKFVTSNSAYWGDHEWVILSNENGKIAPGK